MKLYAPAYYQDFSCIADRCRHSCCIGWEIDVDDDTLQYYQTLDGDYAEAIRGSIDTDDVPHFILAAHDRCPHLDERGLCRIISHYGHDALCDICREHPRFYHQTPHGMEAGLGLSCEEACRIVLGSDAYADMIELEVLDGMPDPDAFDATVLRAQAFALLQRSDLSHAEKLQHLSRAFSVTPAMLSDAQWRALMEELEYLDQSHSALFGCYADACTPPPEAEEKLARALAYFIYRHCSKAEDEQDFCARLGLAMFFERLLCSMICHGHAPEEAARILSEELEYSEDNTNTILSVFDEVTP